MKSKMLSERITLSYSTINLVAAERIFREIIRLAVEAEEKQP